MKKLLSTLLSLSLILSTLPCVTHAASDTGEGKAQRVISGMGCFETYSADTKVKRGEFAHAIAVLLGISSTDSASSWNSSVYGTRNNTTTEIIDKGAYTFDDVEESYPYYNDIMQVYNAGYMQSTATRRFAPEYNITVLEIVKVMADMMGYASTAERYGAYPAGYEKVATETGLLSGISVPIRSVATEAMVCQILYNAFDIKMMEATFGENSGYKTSDKTFAEGMLKIYKVTGAMTDNGLTAMDASSSITDKEVKVGAVIARLADGDGAYRDLLGRRVEMYYTYSDAYDENVVRYMTVLDADNAVTIKAADFVSFNDSTFTYSIGSRTANKHVAATASVIKNNKVVDIYTADTFDIEAGYIILSSTDNSSYDLITIKEYNAFYVSNVNTTESIIYNGITSKTNTANNMITLTDKYYDTINVTDAEGNKRAISDISIGNVLNILSNSDRIDIIISSSFVDSFWVKEITTNDKGETVVSNGTDEYTVLPEYASSQGDLTINSTYKLYLDNFGRVAWVSKALAEGSLVGILVKTYYDEEYETDPGYIQIFTSDDEMKRFETTKNIIYNGSGYKYEDEYKIIRQDIGKPVVYTLNTDGTINSITTPLKYGAKDTTNRGWYEICPVDGVTTYRFGSNGYDFSRLFYYVSGKTKVFYTPTKVTDELYGDNSKFTVAAGFSSVDDNNVDVYEGYAFDQDSAEADVVIQRKYDEDSTGGKSGTVSDRSAFVISAISHGVTEDKEDVIKLTGYEMTISVSTPELKTLTVDPDAVMIAQSGSTFTDKDTEASVGPLTPAGLEVGDIIRYNTNSKQRLNFIRIAYDQSTGKAFLATGDSSSTFAPASSWAGDAILTNGTTIRLSANKKPEAIDYDNPSELASSIMNFRADNKPVIVVDKSSNKTVVRPGVINDITGYNDTYQPGNYDRVAVMTYYTSLVYGVVVYKK